ncbi:class I adenylate-forming enzyme family protein [Flexistipes sinusarabici]|uniref:class I adenylate-forming enzyme family protein n=1 Tax=Flexistipes sinusarabici TaxID=2352 RepID=UPI002352B81D|nr:class I adenylate-forming enzyme family protein [Flexistipes sinusarabici]
MSSYDVERFRKFFEENFTYIKNFIRNVERYPNYTALIDGESGEAWTYAQLNEAANRLANAFLSKGVSAGDVLIYQLLNRPEFAFIYLACQKIGAVNCPVNFRLASGETALILEDSRPKMFLYDEAFADESEKALEISHYKPELIYKIKSADFSKLCDDSTPKEPNTEFTPGAFEEVTRLYTSGTTGLPKGVPLNNINEILTAHDVIMHLGLSDKDRLLNLSPWFHRGGIHIGGPNPGLYAGASLVAMKGFFPKEALDIIQKYSVSVVIGVPTMFTLMLEEQEKKKNDLSSLRAVVSMGAPLEKKLCTKMQEVFTPNVYNGYGTSETFWNTLLGPEDLPEMAGSAGKSCVFDSIRVVKVYEDKLAEPTDTVANNNEEVGEVIIQTFKTSMDYFKKPDEVNQKFYKGWFYTGDIAVWDSKRYIHIRGRKDDMINVGGENIYPTQIEEAINECDLVSDCAVVGVYDEKRGNSIAAYVVGKDENISLGELKDFIKNHPMIPVYKRPRYYRIIDELPMTATGKKQHYKLREQAKKDLRKDMLLR